MTRKWFTAFLVLACAAFVWQRLTIRKLTAEGEQVRAALAQAEALHVERERSPSRPTNSFSKKDEAPSKPN